MTAGAPAPSFDDTRVRMYQREGVDALPTHLADALGVRVTKLRQLDVGVFRVDRAKASPLVARLFSARRDHAAASGDLAVLEQLESCAFPADIAARAAKMIQP